MVAQAGSTQDAKPQVAAPAGAMPPSPATRQQRDEAECNQIAIQSSGYDPAHPPVAAVAAPVPVTGSGARVRGAAVGATVGAIGGNDVGNAAAKGAVAGAVVRRNKNRAAAAQQNKVVAEQKSSAAAYGSARQACLTSRGYPAQ
jgi:hypothetical protein